MQNRGFYKTLSYVVAAVCLYSFIFTYATRKVETQAKEFAKGDKYSEKEYLDSVANLSALNIFVRDITYAEAKEKELKLGLDLKGGINTTLQISIRDILESLSDNSSDSVFVSALNAADQAQKDSNDDYIDLFFTNFEELRQANGGSVSLSSPTVFGNKNNSEKVKYGMSEEEVQDVIKAEVEVSVSEAFRILRARIDKFGVSSPNIQRVGTSGRILVELPGAEDIENVKKLLQSTAKLEFREVVSFNEFGAGAYFASLNEAFRSEAKVEGKKEEVVKKDSSKVSDAVAELLGDDKEEDGNVSNPLFDVLQLTGGFDIGIADVADTAAVNKIIHSETARRLIPLSQRYTKLLWANKPITSDGDYKGKLVLYAVKSDVSDTPPIDGSVVTDATRDRGTGINSAKVTVGLTMNVDGARQWANLTSKNINRPIAIVLDNLVYSAPMVNEAIEGGRSQISGNFTVDEADILANILKAGKLPAKSKIIQSEVVGPSLGAETIQKGMYSFLVALILVLIWMVFYYSGAGIYADIALVANIVFLLGVLISIDAVLTLPGIAGIVLTIGMAVDANVIVFERVREELAKGVNTKAAVAKAFSWKGALSSIIDANVTTLLTAAILFAFGSGPIKGFATTLLIGIITSLFTALIIARLFISYRLDSGKGLPFYTSTTKNWFQNLNIDFLSKRKIGYTISAILLILSVGSLTMRSLNYGTDFLGGRNYIIRFENTVESTDVAQKLSDALGENVDAKIFGDNNQVKVTTKYMIDSEEEGIDAAIEGKIYAALQEYFTGVDEKAFASGNESVGIMSSTKVGPTIADDIKRGAVYATFGSLIVVFLYILLRFRKWQYSAGAVAAVFHDVIILLGVFSAFYGLLPFSLEIDQAFIAAILTVIGYSLNDTVVVFDRIREFFGAKKVKDEDVDTVLNESLNTTLSRTINTSLTTLFVILVIFIFGGETIKGFMFALLVGVIVGTYSSLFIATPVMRDLGKKSLNK